MQCPDCGREFDYPVMVNQKDHIIEDDIFISDVLWHKANLSAAVPSCSWCWYPLTGRQADIDEWKEASRRFWEIVQGVFDKK